MNNCAVCDGCFRNVNPNKIICDGICRQSFHAECANFSKNVLICYREMPNLQWFCDGCIIQTRLSNVSSSLFNKFNSTMVIPASSPSYVQRSLIAAKRKRNRNPFPNAKLNNGSVSLVNRSLKFDHDISNVNGSMNEVQPENNFVKSPDANGSNLLVATEFTKADVAQSSPQYKSTDYIGNLKESSSELKTPSKSSSFAEVLTKSSVAETVSGNSTIHPHNDSIQSPRTTTSSPSDTLKVLYVSKLHPSTTEEDIVNYLLRNNVIKSAEEASCKMLVSSGVNIDMLSFISFKITVSSKLFDSMFKAEVWPKDVIFREFVNR